MKRLKSKWILVAAAIIASAAVSAAVSFFVSGTFNFPPSGGSISPYLVGVYDLEDGEAEVLLVNPTPYDLLALVVQYDDDGQPVDCARIWLSPNDFGEFDLDNSPEEEGVIKVVSVRAPLSGPSTVTVQSGVVGWIRHSIAGTDPASGIADMELKSLPAALLTANANYELVRILDYVNQHCSL